jgi:hypothetical protein
MASPVRISPRLCRVRIMHLYQVTLSNCDPFVQSSLLFLCIISIVPAFKRLYMAITPLQGTPYKMARRWHAYPLY